MPLRDHFRPPATDLNSWEELHGQWPAALVTYLRTRLPPGYVAGPKVHLGSQLEVDIAAFERDGGSAFSTADGGVATAVAAPTRLDLDVETSLTDFDEYEVRVYDTAKGRRRLVAAIEIVSPANKDRQDHRRGFLDKCVGLLRQGVAVSVVDLVTNRRGNLYAQLLDAIGHGGDAPADPPELLYAAACRYTKRGEKTRLQAVSYPLAVGQPLPTLPLWLGPDLTIALDLEPSYEQACHDLWIT